MCSNIAPDSSGDKGRIMDDLRQLGDLAKSFGVRVAWEPICWGRWISDYRDAWDIVRQVDHANIGMVLDSFHVFALDLPVEPIADIDGDKIFLVEVADLPKVNLDFIEMSRSFRLFPGEGFTPIRAFLDQVGKTSYDSFYSVEVFNSYYHTLDLQFVADRAMRTLEALFADR
jgi:4-hydroxyphenylpyruvate dioxygenase